MRLNISRFCAALNHNPKRVLVNYAIQADRELLIDEYEASRQPYGAANQYDVIFLDIEFSGEELGMQVTKNLRKANVQSIIIFLTSYPQYSLEGYGAEALRYLIKPIAVVLGRIDTALLTASDTHAILWRNCLNKGIGCAHVEAV